MGMHVCTNSRQEVLASAFRSGDIKGSAMAVSSGSLCLCMFLLTYICFACVDTFSEGPIVVLATWRWVPLLLFLASVAAEASKFLEGVLKFEGRRKM